MTTKARAWELSDKELIDELGIFSYWWGLEVNGKAVVYPTADNKDEALGLIAEAVARMAKIILVSKLSEET